MLADKLKFAVNVHAELFGPDGALKQETWAHNLVTTAGCQHIADQLSDQGEAAMSHMAIGTGTNAPAAGNTTLQTELDRNALTSGPTQSTNTVVYVADWAAGDGTGAITEAGLFNDASAGTLLARVVFSVINKGAGDTLRITWTLSIADDGV